MKQLVRLRMRPHCTSSSGFRGPTQGQTCGPMGSAGADGPVQGMRRGELLNCAWSDIDLVARTLTVSPKEDTKETWAWLIKDCDRRTLPLTDEVVQMLVDHQGCQPEKHPYVFVLPARYAHIQGQLRAKGKWRYSDSRRMPVPRFNRVFGKILGRAGIECGTFHDLRRTAISNWLAKGLGEFEVMKLAGHSNFSTTHRFYLRVRDDVIDRARKARTRAASSNLARAPFGE